MAGLLTSLPRECPAPFLCTLTRSPSSHSKPRPSWTTLKNTRVCPPTQRRWASRSSVSPAWGSSQPQPTGRLDRPSINGQMGSLSPIRTSPRTRRNHGDISPLGKRQVSIGVFLPFPVDGASLGSIGWTNTHAAGQGIPWASKPLLGGMTIRLL